MLDNSPIQNCRFSFLLSFFPRKKRLPLVLLLVAPLLLAIAGGGCSGNSADSQGGNSVDYHTEAMTMDYGGGFISSDEFKSQVYLGQPVAGSKAEGGEFTAYQGCAPVLVVRINGGIDEGE